MVYIYLILSILSLFFIGYLPTYFLLPGRGGFRVGSKTSSGGFFIFFLSFYIGALMISWMIMVFSLLDIEHDGQLIYVISTAFFIFYIYNILSLRFRNRERKRINKLDRDMFIARKSGRLNKNKKFINNHNITEDIREQENSGNQAQMQGRAGMVNQPDIQSQDDSASQTGDVSRAKDTSLLTRRNRKNIVFRILFIILVALVIINFLVVVFFTIIFPVKFWDAISCWSLKGKAFFMDGIINNFYLEHDYAFSHLSYPLYLPLMQTWVLSWIGEGGMNENLLKIIFPLIYSSLLFVLYYLFRQRVGRLLSILLVFIVSALPIIVDNGYIEYTNLLFSVTMLLAVYFFYMAGVMEGKTSFLILSAIFFCIMTLTRSEGIFYVLLFLVINLFLYISGTVKRVSPGKNLLNLLMPLAVFVLFLGPWYLLKLKLGLPFLSSEWVEFIRSNHGFMSIYGIREAAAAMGSQIWLSLYDSTRAVFRSFYGPVWILLPVLLLFNAKKHFRDYGWIFFIFLCFGLINVFLSLSCIEDFRNSTERYMLHLFPTLYYWVMSNPPGIIRER